MKHSLKIAVNVVLMGVALFGFCVPPIYRVCAREAAHTRLCQAIKTNSYEAVRRAAVDLSKYGGDLNKRDVTISDFQENLVDSEYGEPPTFLIVAIQKNKLEAVKALIDAGADINQKHRDHTVLSLAVEYRNKELAVCLIQKGAQLKVSEWNDYDPLSVAILTQQVDMAKMLIDAGASVCDTSGMGWPLQLLKTSEKATFRKMARQIEARGVSCQ